MDATTAVVPSAISEEVLAAPATYRAARGACSCGTSRANGGILARPSRPEGRRSPEVISRCKRMGTAGGRTAAAGVGSWGVTALQATVASVAATKPPICPRAIGPRSGTPTARPGAVSATAGSCLWAAPARGTTLRTGTSPAPPATPYASSTRTSPAPRPSGVSAPSTRSAGPTA